MKERRRRGGSYQAREARTGYRIAGASSQTGEIQGESRPAQRQSYRAEVLLGKACQAHDRWAAALVHAQNLEDQGRTAELKAARKKVKSLQPVMGLLMDKVFAIMSSDPAFEEHLHERREPFVKTTLMGLYRTAFAIEPIGMQFSNGGTSLYFNLPDGRYELHYRGYVSVVYDANVIQATKKLLCLDLGYELPFSQATCREWMAGYHEILARTVHSNRCIIEEEYIKGGDTN
jgi:hypothetical protein